VFVFSPRAVGMGSMSSSRQSGSEVISPDNMEAKLLQLSPPQSKNQTITERKRIVRNAANVRWDRVRAAEKRIEAAEKTGL
jgi:hypothetical protein